MGLFSSKVSCIGLDIGEHSIKIVALRENTGGYEITRFLNIPALHQEATTALMEVNSEIAAKRVHVAVAVSGENVIVRHLTLPVMPAGELAEAVRFEAEALLPVQAKDAAIDYLKYGVVSDGSVRKQEVLVVAVRNEAIRKLQSAGATLGMEPDTVDIEPLVLQRAIRKLNPDVVPGRSNYAIVNIGFASTNISIFRGDYLYFTRTVFSEEDKLDMEIERSLAYYLAEHRGQDVALVLVTGEGARLEGLRTRMSSRINIPLTVFDPTEYLHINPKIEHTTEEIRAAGTALTQVVGLALSEVD